MSKPAPTASRTSLPRPGRVAGAGPGGDQEAVPRLGLKLRAGRVAGAGPGGDQEAVPRLSLKLRV
jgi:hypothetical protein